MTHPTLPLRPLLLICCLALAAPGTLAAEQATTTSTGTATTTSTVGSSATTETRLSQEFAAFLGGEEQARAVVSGLRQGTAFDLVTETTTTGPSGATTTTTTTTIDPPTGTLGYGNVRITLRLAAAELSRLGITQPTPEELSAILLGGELNGTEIQGILAQRADGMGWGQIAKTYGLTVGQVMGQGAGLAKAGTAAATSPAKSAAPTTRATQGAQARSNGYLPSSPNPSSAATQPRANGYIPSGGGKANGVIVTAGGGSVGSASAGHGKGLENKTTTAGSGTVSAANAPAGQSASANAPGQIKKN